MTELYRYQQENRGEFKEKYEMPSYQLPFGINQFTLYQSQSMPELIAPPKKDIGQGAEYDDPEGGGGHLRDSRKAPVRCAESQYE